MMYIQYSRKKKVLTLCKVVYSVMSLDGGACVRVCVYQSFEKKKDVLIVDIDGYSGCSSLW